MIILEKEEISAPGYKYFHMYTITNREIKGEADVMTDRQEYIYK